MHFDLWPAPMRYCGAVARGDLFAVPSPLHRNSEGGREAKAEALAIFEMKATARTPSPGGARADVVVMSTDRIDHRSRMAHARYEL